MRILGIDPGSQTTGYGIVESRGGRVVHVAHGTFRLRRGSPLAQRLAHLQGALDEVVGEHRPDVVALEQVFVAASPRAALVLGQARGAALAVVGARGLHVAEYTASQIKQGVTGNGSAAKRQVQTMVRRLLELDVTPAADAADALAAAIRHAHGGRLEALGARPRRRRPAARGWSATVRPRR